MLTLGLPCPYISENRLTTLSPTYPNLVFPLSLLLIVPFFPSCLISRHLQSLGSVYPKKNEKVNPTAYLSQLLLPAFLPAIFLPTYCSRHLVVSNECARDNDITEATREDMGKAYRGIKEPPGAPAAALKAITHLGVPLH